MFAMDLMGQGGVGKTAMVMRFCHNEFTTEYMPTIGDMFTKDVEVMGQPRHVQIDDTAGQVRRALLPASRPRDARPPLTPHTTAQQPRPFFAFGARRRRTRT